MVCEILYSRSHISLVGAWDKLDVFTPTQAAAEAPGGDLAQTHQLVVLNGHWLCLGKKEKQHYYLLLTRQLPLFPLLYHNKVQT